MDKLQAKLDSRISSNSLRMLSPRSGAVDFSSNDYLGFAKSEKIYQRASSIVLEDGSAPNGATGSRLISGNYPLLERAEKVVADFHDAESALVFNSGYDANLGFFSSVPQRGDVVLYDELCHASIRDGLRLSSARSIRFAHNDLEELENLIAVHSSASAQIYIATESVFSMDGDSPAITRLASLAETHNCRLVVDEAHALGVFGQNGKGLLSDFGIKVFASIVTFGKAAGCHGAAILSDNFTREYLINFARSFIYTTALPPHSAAAIITAYEEFSITPEIDRLRENIAIFNREKSRLGLRPMFVGGKSAICSAIIPGNERARDVAAILQNEGFDVRAILSPTVPEGQERLRICLHSYNTQSQIESLLNLLAHRF